MDHSLALSQPVIDTDAGRRYLGAHRHRREIGALISPNLSPTRSPYPLPYYNPRTTKINPKLHRDAEPLITTITSTHSSSTDEPPLPSSAPRHLRNSVPDVIYKHGPRIPSSSSLALHGGPAAIHGTRARFVSLPAVISSFPNIDTECDRLERACGRTPTAHLRLRDDPPPSSPHQPRGNGPPPPLAPKWSHWALVLRIKRALRRDGKDIRDYVEADHIDELFRRDVEERGRRERERGRMARMRSGQEQSDSDENTHIFGVPLNEGVLRASATAILGGYRHDLPLVVFLCVEELYRTGIYKSGLFRDLPNRQRHHELITLFNTPPAFGEGMSLRAESTPDICALLLTYLKELPEPVLTPYLFNAFWNWCVRPSVKREDERMRKEQDEEEDLRARFFQTGQRPPRPSHRVLFEKARLRAVQDNDAESGQVAVARDLLRLLPTHSFSLIVYLCAFFTQVPLCPENGITFEDIGRIFGPPVFGGPVPAARRMMVWFLKRWNRVSDGLLDVEPDDNATASAPSSPPLSRRDMLVLERADAFELLAPDEQEEDELDFRAALIDSEERRGFHSAKIEPANTAVSSLQTQNRCDRYGSGCVAQEIMIAPSGPPGWLGEAKGRGRERSLDPDDSILQVPPRDKQPHSGFRSVHQETLFPPHVFAPMSPRQSVRSPEGNYSEVTDKSEGRDVHAAAEDATQSWSTDARLLIALSRLHEARARIDELELAVADAAAQSGRAREKLAYFAGVTTEDGDLDSYARFEQELKLTALERGEANELVKNVCAVLTGVVQQAACAEVR